MFEVLDAKYNSYTQSELKDVGVDFLALNADEMYGIFFSFHHETHETW